MNTNKQVRIRLWNAIIRPTLTYALQTHELSPRDARKLGRFMFKSTRPIVEPWWYKPGKHITKSIAYQKYSTQSIKKMARKSSNNTSSKTDHQYMEHTPRKTDNDINKWTKWKNEWIQRKKLQDRQGTRAAHQQKELEQHLLAPPFFWGGPNCWGNASSGPEKYIEIGAYLGYTSHPAYFRGRYLRGDI